MVLLADANRGSDEAKSQVALINHRVSIAGAIAADVTVGDGIRRVAVAGYDKNATDNQQLQDCLINAHLQETKACVTETKSHVKQRLVERGSGPAFCSTAVSG